MLTGQEIAYLQAKGVDRKLIKQHVLNALSEVDFVIQTGNYFLYRGDATRWIYRETEV